MLIIYQSPRFSILFFFCGDNHGATPIRRGTNGYWYNDTFFYIVPNGLLKWYGMVWYWDRVMSSFEN